MPELQLAEEYLKELHDEATATRKCLERIPMTLSDYKPHEKSMALGYLALLVAEMPNWITYIIEKGEIDFGTFTHYQPATTEDLVKHFEDNMQGARKALKGITNEQLQESFALKNKGQLLFSSSKKVNVSSTIRHWVHHRGQLTVYMRLNNIAVPSIYGPSADEKTF
ncbi:MAG TPA: DinB family protein [Flavitalea sp.]|nr:DinB family protein [Flavitalea sp.]